MKSSRDVIEQRHQDILGFLRENSTGSVAKIAKELQVSQVTIRRDLDALEEQGVISRYFGGAKLVESPLHPHTEQVLGEDSQNCLSIAKKAAEFLQDGDTVFVNSSSTALNIYGFIEGKRIVAITNNGNSLAAPRNEGTDLILTGGEVYGNKHSLVGEYALIAISKVKCSKCIIGVSGISVEGGITSSILAETAINRAMIHNSIGPVIVVADGSKVGTIQDFHSANINSVTHLITDSEANPDEVEKIKKAGVEVITV